MRELQEKVLDDIFGSSPVTDREMRFYRELSLNTFQKTLNSLFPITKKACIMTSSEQEWGKLGARYIAENRPKSYQLSLVFEKFPEWLEPKWSGGGFWIRELVNYEWARHLVGSARDPNSGDWVNPSLVLRSYEFSIPQWYIENEIQNGPPAERKTWIAMFRELETDRIRVLELHESAFELLIHWADGVSPRETAEILSVQLSQSIEDCLFLMGPLLTMLNNEGVLRWPLNEENAPPVTSILRSQ